MRKITPYIVLGGQLTIVYSLTFLEYKVYAYIFIFSTYSLLLLLIWRRKDHLEAYKLDRLSLLAFILFGSILHLPARIPGEIFYQAFIGLCSVGMLLFFLKYKRNIPSTNSHWFLSAVLITLPVLLIVIFIVSLEPLEKVTYPSLTAEIISKLFFNFSYVTPYEEFLFRGFLTTYLVRSGWSEKKALWGQGIVFWLGHLKLGAPLTFFIAVPIITLLFSFLAYKSRQLFPGIIAHTIINVFS
jgi:membrane protease YdiL (CAAX protease family)